MILILDGYSEYDALVWRLIFERHSLSIKKKCVFSERAQRVLSYQLIHNTMSLAEINNKMLTKNALLCSFVGWIDAWYLY